MSQLEKNLCIQYEIGSCLTGRQLDWANGTTIRIANDCDAETLSVNPFFDYTSLKRGAAVQTLGVCRDAFNIVGDQNAFIFGSVLKTANNNFHYSLPKQLMHLSDAMSIAAKDFARTTPYADTYICGIMYRQMPVLQQQIAENWHTHKILTPTTMPDERADNLEVSSFARASLSGHASDMVAIEYLVSDKIGSHFQTAKAAEDLNVSENIGAYTITGAEAEKFSHRQLIDGEFAKGNSYTFHRAASVPSEMVGQTRSLFVMSFTPSIRTRLAYR